MYVRKVSLYIRNGYLNHCVIGRVTCLLPGVIAGPIKVSVNISKLREFRSGGIKVSRFVVLSICH